MKFESIENAIKSKLNGLLKSWVIGEQRSIDHSNTKTSAWKTKKKTCQLTSWKQKNQMVELLENYERYVNTLPVFGFNSGKYDLNLIKEYLIPYLINDRDIQPTVIKKSNQFVSFKFGNIQFRYIEFSEEQLLLIHFWKLTEQVKPADFFLMSSLIYRIS